MKPFTHVSNFTDYMKIAEKIILDPKGERLDILDMPAGNGLLAERLRNAGHTVTCADINSERQDYVFVNMEQPLPFAEASFDVISCLEGIEHIINPDRLIKELSRVLRPNGLVILSLPNIQSLYSRLMFLFSGIFYQYEPENYRHPGGAQIDRGHISPLALPQLTYLFGEYGLTSEQVTGDRVKKKILLPIYLLLWFANVITLKLRVNKEDRPEVRLLYDRLSRFRPMVSRSLITVWRKDTGTSHAPLGIR